MERLIEVTLPDGSQVQVEPGSTVRQVAARRGVILAAGALETPRLLMLSGIGPAAGLRALGLPVSLDAPGVGDNLQDHPLIRALNFRSRRPLPAVRDNGGGANLNWRSDPAVPRPDLHAFPVAGRSATPELAAAHALPETGIFAIGPGLMGSKSRGRLRLTGAEPDARLHVEPGFLTHPGDLVALTRGVRFILDLARRPALAALTDGPLAPGPNPTDAEIADFLRLACSTFFHCCGTARMGSDPEAVTDPRLRLHGLAGLWIADASVIPEIPSCNTHSVATMIGERAAGFILEDA